MAKCEHMQFGAEVDVHRLTDEAGVVRAFSADVRVRCVDCGTPFQFLGLPAGINMRASTVSVDGLEARLALSPDGEEASPLGHVAAAFAPGRKH